MALKPNKACQPGEPPKMDLTPMIDCTFQLIIFFILVTDMSQRELEILTLPMAPISVEDDGQDKERIVVNIVDPNNADAAREMNPNWPPIYIKGEQMQSLDQMRAKLLAYADPRRYPDTTVNMVEPKLKLYPSKKPLLIRCDQNQVFGWVQAVMQYCTIVPKPRDKSDGEHLAYEYAHSPLIHKIELAAKRKDASEVDPNTGK